MAGLHDLSPTSRERLRPASLPATVEPMLATLTDRRFSDPGWIFERKLDGERVLALGDGEAVHLVSRSDHRLDATYPELVDALAGQRLPPIVVDGEVVAFERGRTSFGRLQQRLGVHDAEQARRSTVAVYYYLFDLLHLDGQDTTGLPLRDRKRLLRSAVHFAGPLRYTTHRNAAGEDEVARACERGWEGVIAKRADAPYRHGRSGDWLKMKCSTGQELVVGGFTDPAGSRVGLGALLLGYHEGGALRYAGKVGTGFSREVLTDLRRRLDGLRQDQSPFTGPHQPTRGVHWARPQLVAQIAFTEWTTDGMLRHPRFEGLRDDKAPAEVVRERPGGGSRG